MRKFLINNGLNPSLQGQGAIRIDVNEDDLNKCLIRSFGTSNENYEIFQANKRAAELWREHFSLSQDYVVILICEKGTFLKLSSPSPSPSLPSQQSPSLKSLKSQKPNFFDWGIHNNHIGRHPPPTFKHEGVVQK